MSLEKHVDLAERIGKLPPWLITICILCGISFLFYMDRAAALDRIYTMETRFDQFREDLDDCRQQVHRLELIINRRN